MDHQPATEPNRITLLAKNLWARWKEFRVNRRINRTPVMSESWRVQQKQQSHFDRNVGN
jgi:hypothetical protein